MLPVAWSTVINIYTLNAQREGREFEVANSKLNSKRYEHFINQLTALQGQGKLESI